MTESRIEELLDVLVPPFEPRPDGWSDVLARARRTRRRYAVAAAAAAALLIVPTAVALRGEITSFFQGTPAPPDVSTSFESNNRVADLATRQGFAERYPQADVSQAHGVIEVQTLDGPEDLWAAPDDQGGRCWWVDFANDPAGPDGKYGFGGCDVSADYAVKIDPAVVWIAAHPDLSTLWGRVYVPADRVLVQLQDGSSRTLPVVESGFLASLDRDARLQRVTAYDGDEQVASWEATVG
jgi:hypothetical protein